MDKKTSGAAAKTDQAKVEPATGFDPSGAPLQVVEGIDTSHPAVDADPRAGTSADQNRIDFNDPTKSEQEAVAENLGLNAKAD